MKIAGIVLVILGALALMGAISAGDNILGPLVWIIVGVFLIVRANHKIKYNEKQEETNDWTSTKNENKSTPM